MIMVMKRRERIISVIMALVMGMSFVSPGVLAAEDTKVYDLSFDNKTYSADTTGIDFGRAGGDQWKRAQTFMALEGGKLESVEVKVTALNNPGDIIAELYATDPLGGITGEALASAEISKDQVPSGSFAEVSIPLKYDGLISGKMYAVMLTQKTVSGWYGWYCSFDATNANWWDSSVDTVVNGVKKVNGKTYLYKNGKAVTGTRIVTVSGKTYAVVKGCVRTGKSRMVTIGKKSYIVNKSGIVQKAKKGKLIKLTKTKWYVVNKSGAVQKAKKGCAVVKAGKRRYIVNKKGLVQKPKKGYKLIKAGKKKYIVNKNGFVQISKKRIKIKKTVYKTNKNGTALKR